MSITATLGGTRPDNYDVNLNVFREKFTADGAIVAGQLVTLTGNMTVEAVASGSTHTNPTIGIAYKDAADGEELAVYTSFLAVRDGVTATASLVAGMPVRSNGLVSGVESFKSPAVGEIVNAVVLSVGGATAGSATKVGILLSPYTHSVTAYAKAESKIKTNFNQAIKSN